MGGMLAGQQWGGRHMCGFCLLALILVFAVRLEVSTQTLKI
jgi:hypothetical protein